VQVDFYQLGRTPLPRVLAQIAGRIVGDGGRLLVVTGDGDQAAAIDQALWEGADSFLPHGREGADQPVLIGQSCDATNGARYVALADGLWREEALGFERTFHLFDDDTLAAARDVWRTLAKADDVTRNFWKQDEGGRWTKAA
jgi:DNA polymerase III subunit chi